VAGGGGAPTTGEVADATPPDVYHDPVPAPPGTADGAKPQVRQIAEGVEAEIPTERHDLVRE
jgi:hypothetical protein